MDLGPEAISDPMQDEVLLGMWQWWRLEGESQTLHHRHHHHHLTAWNASIRMRERGTTIGPSSGTRKKKGADVSNYPFRSLGTIQGT